MSREVLRSYPIAPVTFIGVAKKDLELDGYAIRAGWKGAGAIWATLQDGTTFTDPTKFDGDAARRRHDRRAADRRVRAAGRRPARRPPLRGRGADPDADAGVPRLVHEHYDLACPAQDASPGGGGLGPLPEERRAREDHQARELGRTTSGLSVHQLAIQPLARLGVPSASPRRRPDNNCQSGIIRIQPDRLDEIPVGDEEVFPGTRASPPPCRSRMAHAGSSLDALQMFQWTSAPVG